MALSFHPEGKFPSTNYLKCPILIGKDNMYFIDMDGYHFYMPSARDYIDVIEHLTILQECFEKGFTLLDATKE